MFQNREVAFTIFKISINNKEIVNDMVQFHLLQHTQAEICLPLPSFARLFYFWVQLETNGGVGQIAWTSWSSVEWPTFFRNFFYLFVLLHLLWIFLLIYIEIFSPKYNDTFWMNVSDLLTWKNSIFNALEILRPRLHLLRDSCSFYLCRINISCKTCSNSKLSKLE